MRLPSRGGWRERSCRDSSHWTSRRGGWTAPTATASSPLIEDLADRGAGLVVATHDVEFAAAFAERVVLLGDGCVIADGPVEEILSGGWYFATEVARVLDLPGVITPEQGAAVLMAGDAS